MPTADPSVEPTLWVSSWCNPWCIDGEDPPSEPPSRSPTRAPTAMPNAWCWPKCYGEIGRPTPTPTWDPSVVMCLGAGNDTCCNCIGHNYIGRRADVGPDLW